MTKSCAAKQNKTAFYNFCFVFKPTCSNFAQNKIGKHYG